MIYHKQKQFVSIAEIWYNFNEKPEGKADVLRYKFVAERYDRAVSLEELYTILVDLKQSPDALFSQVRKSSRYQIGRAENKDGVKAITFFTKDEKNEEKITQYIDYFNKFALSKGRSQIFFSDLEQFYNAGTLCIRCAVQDGEPDCLTSHAYVVSDNTARLHQSSSFFRDSEDVEYRNLIGRANRFLHWDDIVFFQSMGIEWYDFGGWYGGKETTGTYAEQLLINQFKESFGGEKKREYSYIVPVTLKGKLAVGGRGIIKAIKSIKNCYRFLQGKNNL